MATLKNIKRLQGFLKITFFPDVMILNFNNGSTIVLPKISTFKGFKNDQSLRIYKSTFVDQSI